MSERWRPLRDSNPCSRRERAVSWASRRRGHSTCPYLTARRRGIKSFASGLGWRPADGRRLLPKIYVLQRLLDLHSAQMGDRGLEVVALLARDAQLVALDGDLNLELAVLDLAHEALGELLVDTLFEEDDLTHGVARG